MCVSVHRCVKVSRQLVGIRSLFSLCESQGLNSGHQALWQMALPRESSCWPWVDSLLTRLIFIVIFLHVGPRNHTQVLTLRGTHFSDHLLAQFMSVLLPQPHGGGALGLCPSTLPQWHRHHSGWQWHPFPAWVSLLTSLSRRARLALCYAVSNRASRSL